MKENEQNPQLKEVENQISVHRDHRPNWKLMHHTWIFWVFLLLMLAAIMYYIVTVNFQFAP